MEVKRKGWKRSYVNSSWQWHLYHAKEEVLFDKKNVFVWIFLRMNENIKNRNRCGLSGIAVTEKEAIKDLYD